MKSTLKIGAALLSMAALASCYRTRFELSPPQPEAPSAAYSDHFHFSVINIIEVSRPVDLQRACNGAPPTAIEEQVGILGAVVNAALSYFLPIISVHNATVYCPIGTGMMGAPQYQGQPYPQQYPQGGQPYPQQYPQGGQPAPQ